MGRRRGAEQLADHVLAVCGAGGGDQQLVAGGHLGRLHGLSEAGQSRGRADPYARFVAQTDVGDPAVTQVDQVLGRHRGSGGVVDRHRRRAGQPLVDEDQRQAELMQALSLLSRQLQRSDDQRVGIATGRQGGEELVPLTGTQRAIDQQFLAAIVQDLVDGVQQTAVEPRTQRAADQDRDPVEFARGQTGSGARNGEGQVIRRLDDPFGGLGGDQR